MRPVVAVGTLALLVCAHAAVAAPLLAEQQASRQKRDVAPIVSLDPLFGLRGERENYKREIDATNFASEPKLSGNVLSPEFLKIRSKRPYLITRVLSDKNVIATDDVIVDSNVLFLKKPNARLSRNLQDVERELIVESDGEAKQRSPRGWNLQHVVVPNAYPYIPYANPKASQRWRRQRS